MYHELTGLWKKLLRTGLQEDGCRWDWTSLGALQGRDSQVKARIIAKSPGLWASQCLVKALSQLGETLEIRSNYSDGDSFKTGDVIVIIEGKASEILAFERPFLNLAAYSSGIATATAEIVQLVKHACPRNSPRVTLTRKTLPGYRDICIHSVRTGGGHPHRLSLSSGILIKENHIAAAGGISRAIEGVRSVAPHGLKIEVEVTNLKEMDEAISSNADGVLLDNFTPDQVRSALTHLRKCSRIPFVEVSGGLSRENVSLYAQEGVQILSFGSLTHSVQSTDFSLLLSE